MDNTFNAFLASPEFAKCGIRMSDTMRSNLLKVKVRSQTALLRVYTNRDRALRLWYAYRVWCAERSGGGA